MQHEYIGGGQNALKTVATHSILSVNSIPEPAVDLLSKVTNGKE